MAPFLSVRPSVTLVKKLRITELRLFPELELAFTPGVNLIQGGNGQGKTTVLEALYLAGRGKTFRHHRTRPLIRESSASSMVVAHTECPPGVIGVEVTRGHTRIRVDGTDLKRRSDLLRRFPLQLMTPQSHRLVESGPRARRVFVDFGLFHVEPSFQTLYSEFERCLRQRNAALVKEQDARAFEPRLAQLGEELSRVRTEYIRRLENRATPILEQLLPDVRFELRNRRGWAKDKNLSEALEAARVAEERIGYTTVGPQRADLGVWTKLGPAEKVLSRGQQKLLVCGLILAQAMLMVDGAAGAPVLLFDDLGAELDRSNRTRVISLLHTVPLQTVATHTEVESEWDPYLDNVFHVEHKLSSAQSTDG